MAIVHSDGAANLLAPVLAEICRVLGIRRTFSLPYHHDGNGLTESAVKIFWQMLQVYANTITWDEMVALICFAYNTRPADVVVAVLGIVRVHRSAVSVIMTLDARVWRSAPTDIGRISEARGASGAAWLWELGLDSGAGEENRWTGNRCVGAHL